ncbi:MAG TPA: TetR/AcrR family transcriptional regulator [Puia sp.]
MARTKDFNEEEVLDKALAIFWQKGYNGTSMQDLVEELGISRSSMYDTYTDKYSLFLKSLEKYRKQTAGALLQMINEAESPKAVIKKILQLVVDESLLGKEPRGCFMVNTCVENAPHDKAVAKIIHDNLQDYEEAFCQAIKKGQAMGEITSRNDAKALARFIINTINGIRVAARSGADKAVYDDIVKVALSVLE